MGKTVVVYKSKTGYTKTYAEWIANELKCDLKENDKLGLKDLEGYDTIIYGGALYASGINGISLIKKNYDMLRGKNLIVWATGCSPGRDKEMKLVWEKNFTTEQLKKIRTFYLRGGFDFSKLGTRDRLLMNMLKARLKKEKNPSEDTLGMLHAYEVPEDHRDRKNIAGLVECARNLK